ncbi:MAG: hypothetical protein LBF36_02655, partial [Mycoplasmataceae bacterium]|nr:hypothetical protein [Mycoplasmataceae bacterium]
MKKRKTLKGITSILGIGILGTTLAMSLSNCGNKPPIETIRTIDGSDWNGRQSGTMLYSVSTEDKVVTYTGSSDDYAAVNLVFPG